LAIEPPRRHRVRVLGDESPAIEALTRALKQPVIAVAGELEPDAPRDRRAVVAEKAQAHFLPAS